APARASWRASQALSRYSTCGRPEHRYRSRQSGAVPRLHRVRRLLARRFGRAPGRAIAPSRDDDCGSGAGNYLGWTGAVGCGGIARGSWHVAGTLNKTVPQQARPHIPWRAPDELSVGAFWADAGKLFEPAKPASRLGGLRLDRPDRRRRHPHAGDRQSGPAQPAGPTTATISRPPPGTHQPSVLTGAAPMPSTRGIWKMFA